VNYFGEILQAVAMAIPGAIGAHKASDGQLWNGIYSVAWLYPLYYVMLFLPRQADDDIICELKYGKPVWDEYKNRVPSKIIPGLL
jgi:hypothetical protein